MFNGRRGPVAGLLAGVVALGLTIVAPGAQAAPATPVGATAASTTTTAATSRAELASVSGYWTAQRLANARPADRARPQSASATATQSDHRAGPPGSIAPAAAIKPTPQDRRAEQSRRGDITPLAVSASATVGKVFFHDPSNGKDWVCSASTLNSGSKQLVLTAGHCVHGGAGKQFMTNWVFIPQYYYGSQPYGQWQAKYYHTFPSWTSSTDWNRDVAMVTMWPNSSGAVVNVVGGNGLTWNRSYYLPITVMGYPAEAPYDGGWQWACQGNTTRFGSEFKIAMQCGFTGGSSGGPWFHQYDSNTGLGYSNGATSTLDTASWNRASYFDTSVYNMYTSAANLT
jgi:V8-like Glu-specific endopeptidase